MNVIAPILFSGIAAIGNALFALGQRQSTSPKGGLVFVGGSALIACLLCAIVVPMSRTTNALLIVKYGWKALLLSGFGLFLTYVGFNALYTRFGTTPYLLYASMSILTTTVGVGFLYLREPITTYHIAAILCALAAIVLYSLG